MKTIGNSILLLSKVSFWFLMVQFLSIAAGSLYEPLAFLALPIGHMNPSLGNAANPALATFQLIVILLAVIYMLVGLGQGVRSLFKGLSSKH